MNTKRFLFCVLIVCSLLGLCSCGFTNSKEKDAAQEYIEKKYGQEAKVVKVNKNYKFTGPGGGLLPDGIASDDSYNFIMEMDGRQFDLCLVNGGSGYIGYDNYEEDLIKVAIIEDIESQLDIRCEDIYMSYGEIYEKYGTNMIHTAYSDLSSICENGRFAIIVATYDSIDTDRIAEYAKKYSVQDEKSILRIEVLQYRDVIPTLSFSSFYEVNDPQYVLDWYTISNGELEHHDE